jgi:hypothetical protein
MRDGSGRSVFPDIHGDDWWEYYGFDVVPAGETAWRYTSPFYQTPSPEDWDVPYYLYDWPASGGPYSCDIFEAEMYCPDFSKTPDPNYGCS